MSSIRNKLLLWLLPGLGILWGAAGTAIYYSVRHGLESQLDLELRELVNAARYKIRPRPFGSPQPEPGHGPANHAAFDDPDSGQYFQVWVNETNVVHKSKSLVKMAFKQPTQFSSSPEFSDFMMPNGEVVRRMTARVSFNPPGGKRRGGPGPPWMFGGERFGREGWDRDNDRERDRDGQGGRVRGFRGGPGLEDGRRGPDRDEGRRGPETINIVVAKNRIEVDRTLGLLLGGILASGFIAAIASTFLVGFALRSGLRPLEAVGDQASKIDAASLQTRFATDNLPAELRPIATRLNDLMARMEDSFERERRFSADLAHELRTPVAELKSMAEVAIKWPEQADPENYQDVQDISERMQGTIENLLTLARLENQRANITREPINLASLAKANWKPFAKSARERDLSFAPSIGTDERIESDQKLLGIILTNLFSNAADYAPKNSTIKAIGATDGNRNRLFSISNDAPELTSNDVKHLFERLWRKDKSRTDDSHSGLGLAIAKSCADVLDLRLAATLDGKRLTISLDRK